ncbi:MAG: Fic family protein [Candidatus Micrarchaeota archaeon]
MATIKTKVVGTKKYYYLQHTVRTARGIETRQKYLGTTLPLPAKINELKAEFLAEIYKERWYPKLDKIKQNYAKEQKKIPKSMLEKQVRTFSVKFTYDSNRIEGSKLTYRETADLLERGLTPRSKPVEDVKEAEAHEKTFYEMLDYEKRGKDLNEQTMLYWHKKLFEATKLDIAGKIRGHQVAISGSKFMPPTQIDVPVLLREFFRWYEKSKNKSNPVELAALVHLKLVTIHPFGDGNGRISRLLMNFVLSKHSFPMLNIPYENRGSYYHALERSQTKKIDGVFVQWFFKKYVSEYAAYAN